MTADGQATGKHEIFQPRPLHGERFETGIEVLLARHRDWLDHRRVGLLSHEAAVNAGGMTTAELLHEALGDDLVAIFGPEHGFAVTASAGAAIADTRHPFWNIPVVSLYGKAQKPAPSHLSSVDTLIVDMHNLAARPYTYISTLRYTLEATAEAGKTVIVADRPVPLPCCVDGPVLDPAFESFVGCVRTAMHYGMTPAEAALWLKADLDLNLDLRVAPMRSYHRESHPHPGWPPWVPPSPRIRSREIAVCYTVTVAAEALPALNYGSGTEWPFQVFGGPWINADAVIDALKHLGLPGITFEPFTYTARAGAYAGMTIAGVRLLPTDESVFRPVLTGVSLLACLQRLYGRQRLWDTPGARPDFFDKLFGTDTVRLALLDGESGEAIAERWAPALTAFSETRESCLLYPAL